MTSIHDIKFIPKRLKNAIALSLFGLIFSTASTEADAPIDIRVALVIGNASYKHVPELANSANDAKSMGLVLRKLGFSVVEVVDGNKDVMNKAVDQMQSLLKGKQAVGMLYYAGHGLQLDWHNFMVPVDAKLTKASDVTKETIDIDKVITAFKQSSTRLNIIVLDACRDNPFTDKASGKGLAQLDAPSGTYLAFATSPGNVAEDGDESSGNGLFTHYLIKELQKPARIEDVFKRVRLQVRQKSEGRQIPWDSSSLEDDFAFNDGVKHTFNPEDLIKEAKHTIEKEAKLKLEVQAAKAQAETEAKLRKQSKEEQFAIQKSEWDKIKDSKNVNDFYAFLEKYPSGFITEQATFALEKLSSGKVLPAPNQNGIKIVENKVRFRVGDSQINQITDLNTGTVLWEGSLTVERIANNLAYVKVDQRSEAEIYTLDGGITKGGATEDVYSWDPPRVDLPGDELVVGKKWTARTIETVGKTGNRLLREDQTTIVAYEDVTVPAGTFKAFKIVMNSSYNNGTVNKRTYWVESGWGFNLKTIRDIKRANGNNQHQVIEMVSRTKGGSS